MSDIIQTNDKKQPKKTKKKMMELERRYSNEYGRLRRLTSKIDGQIRKISVSSFKESYHETVWHYF